MNDRFNVIILGTSPLAITEAVWQKSKGKTVLNIDDKSLIGGAWTTIKHDGIPAVEIGCHIWSVEKGATDFLETFFDLNLVSLEPPPRIVKNGFSIPYDWKINYLTGKYVISKLIRFQFKEMKKGLKSPARTVKLIPRKYLYPKGGANELHAQLVKKVQSEKLNISLETSLRKVKIMGQKVQLELKNGDQLLTDELVVTSLSSIEKIEFADGTSISPKTEQVDYIHVHLVLKTSIPRNFSYERWMNDEYIHRVSDMTSQVGDQLQSSEKLLCVGIHAEKYHQSTHEVLLKEIIDRLKIRKLIEKSAELIQHGFNVFPSYYNPPTKLLEIEKRSNGKITVVRSTSFTYSFYNQADRYSELI